MRTSRLTSARRGRFSRVRVSSVKRLAIISGRAAFLAPEILISPFSRDPPLIRMRSMFAPFAPLRRRDSLDFTVIAERCRGFQRGLRGRGRPAALLSLAALEVLAQGRGQTLAPGLRLAVAPLFRRHSGSPAAIEPRGGLDRPTAGAEQGRWSSSKPPRIGC